MKALTALCLVLSFPAYAEEPTPLDGVEKIELWRLYQVTASRRDELTEDLSACELKLQTRTSTTAGMVERIQRTPSDGSGVARVLWFVGGVLLGGTLVSVGAIIAD